MLILLISNIQHPLLSEFGFLFACVLAFKRPHVLLQPDRSFAHFLLNMLSSFVTALALAASVSNVAAGPLRHASRGYAQDADILEDYTPFHIRYLALGCSGGHGTPFFEKCCHPLLRWQKLEDRPAECIPSPSASSSAALVEPTSPPVDVDPIPDYDDDFKPEPEPTTTKKTTSAAPEPTQGSGGSEEITGGFATFFSQGGSAGACGDYHADTDKVVALDYRRYGPLDQKSSDCGRMVLITNTKNGKTVTAKVADACPTCQNGNCLDLSYGAFDQIATREEGMVAISWHFIS
ncbi:hypothetical protein OPQ81_006530 [Rhizoctonia solani]|nr:hypothetical protein OPQ81_006530 [Rhizoctonia solani]